MTTTGQETEAKFYVRDIERIRSRVEELAASVVQPRVLETNIRFDLPGAPLRAQGRVLRLRRDTEIRLTYKSGSTSEEGVLSREEIEFGVEDFEKAKRFLEALGYRKLVYYEKYRTTYSLEDALIMLDELPYGNFVEIEGTTVASIRALADRLGLNWEGAIGASYHALFDRVRTALNLTVADLSFIDLADIKIEPADLGVLPADA
jgi:adenylate cyclase class 2